MVFLGSRLLALAGAAAALALGACGSSGPPAASGASVTTLIPPGVPTTQVSAPTTTPGASPTVPQLPGFTSGAPAPGAASTPTPLGSTTTTAAAPPTTAATAGTTTTTAGPTTTTDAAPAAATTQPRTVTVTDADSGGSVTLAVGDTLVVRLSGCGDCGYSWDMTGQPNTAVMRYDGEQTEPESTPTTAGQPPSVGGNDYDVFTFTATGAHTTSLVIGYYGPGRITASETFTLDIHVTAT